MLKLDSVEKNHALFIRNSNVSFVIFSLKTTSLSLINLSEVENSPIEDSDTHQSEINVWLNLWHPIIGTCNDSS